ncbi:MAG: Quinoprotein glucose dehydrogenase [Rhizobacter sp.]|nr:Quinoprotein glucose dehydrogenase [Rhizobacter sp.]
MKPIAIALLAALAATLAHADAGGWGSYGGAPGGGQYSGLTQITPANVSQLKLLWTFRTGELGAGMRRPDKLTFEANPILAEGRLYVITARNSVMALDPLTGKQLWRFDAKPKEQRYSEVAARGVSSWVDTQVAAGSACRQRILFGTLDARLIALDGATGQPCQGFGDNGEINLQRGIRIRDAGDYQVTSPPAIAGDVVVVGSAIGDNRAVELEEGVVRAFDVRSGRALWSWDPIPRRANANANANHNDWQAAQAAATGAANAWPPLSVDAERGLVFVPTGSASPDYFGGKRLGSNRDANSLVALRVATGEVAWRQQLVHHDLWDYDLASQPVLADVTIAGKPRAAVMQATKTGMLFVFDRVTGEPLFPMEERAVPASDIAGEQASPTQPFPPPALVFTRQQPVTEDDAWGFTPLDRWACRRKIKGLRAEGVYTPPSLRGTIMYPGYGGGVNWGGLAFDPQRQRVIVATMQVPMVVTLVPHAADAFASAASSGRFPDSQFSRMSGTPYGMRRELLMSPIGVPCTAPPWGKLVAIDLAPLRQVWEQPIGTTAKKAPIALSLGMPFMGGPVATAGGLVFMAGTTDNRFRALDTDTGKTLWETELPAGGNATPAVFEVGGKQIVVIAAGGHGGLGTTLGDHVMAFALGGADR